MLNLCKSIAIECRELCWRIGEWFSLCRVSREMQARQYAKDYCRRYLGMRVVVKDVPLNQKQPWTQLAYDNIASMDDSEIVAFKPYLLEILGASLLRTVGGKIVALFDGNPFTLTMQVDAIEFSRHVHFLDDTCAARIVSRVSTDPPPPELKDGA